MIITKSRGQDLIKEHIDKCYDISKVRPNKPFDFRVEPMYDEFKKRPYEFIDMVRAALINSVMDYYALLGSKARTPNDTLTDGARIMREKVAGRMTPLNHVYKDIPINLVMTPNIKLCSLSSDNERVPMCFDVRVIGMYDKKSYTKYAEYMCTGCTARLKVESDPITKKQPKKVKCNKCKIPMENIEGLVITGDVQTLIIQERMEDSVDMNVEKKFAKVYDGLVGQIKPGDNIRIIGVYRSLIKENHIENEVIIDIISTSNLEDIKPILPSNEEIKKWKEDSKDEEKFFSDVVDSFARSVKGYKTIKMSLLMTIVGGIAIRKKNGQKKRGTINTFLVGDRSTAKSQLLKACKQVAHKSILTGGKGVSAVGLTAGVIKQSDGSSMVELGVYPLCDMGTAIIDEFDKMSKDDRGVLHIVMEDQFVPINKGGFNLNTQARTTTIAAANPKGGKWGKVGKDLMDNVNLDEPMLTRFDNIFLFLDVVDDVKDTEIGLHMLNSWSNQENEIDQVYMDMDQIKKFINYVKPLEPELSEKAKIKLLEFFKKIRNMSNTQDSLPVAFRSLDGIVRMSMARAKMLFRTTVTEADAEIAIMIYKHMLSTFGIDIESGVIQEVFGKPKEVKKDEAFWQVFDQCKDPNGDVHESDFIEELCTNKISSRFFDEDKASKEWTRKKTDLEILRNSNGTYRRS